MAILLYDKYQQNATNMQYFKKGKNYTVIAEEICESNDGEIGDSILLCKALIEKKTEVLGMKGE